MDVELKAGQVGAGSLEAGFPSFSSSCKEFSRETNSFENLCRSMDA